jgi:hypothetical protein
MTRIPQKGPYSALRFEPPRDNSRVRRTIAKPLIERECKVWGPIQIESGYDFRILNLEEMLQLEALQKKVS